MAAYLPFPTARKTNIRRNLSPTAGQKNIRRIQSSIAGTHETYGEREKAAERSSGLSVLALDKTARERNGGVMAKKEPIRKFQLGSVCAAVWTNQNEKGEFWYNVTIARRYRDGDEWKDSNSFSRDELPLVSKAADMAYSWIWDRLAAPPREQEVEA
jgi:hypothetical protein